LGWLDNGGAEDGGRPRKSLVGGRGLGTQEKDSATCFGKGRLLRRPGRVTRTRMFGFESWEDHQLKRAKPRRVAGRSGGIHR